MKRENSGRRSGLPERTAAAWVPSHDAPGLGDVEEAPEREAVEAGDGEPEVEVPPEDDLGYEADRGAGGEGGLGDLGQLAGDLHGGVPGAHDHNTLPSERPRVAVLGGVEDPAAEGLLAGEPGAVGPGEGARGGDQGSGPVLPAVVGQQAEPRARSAPPRSASRSARRTRLPASTGSPKASA